MKRTIEDVLLEAVAVHSDVAVFDYRGAVPDGGASTVLRLGERPLAVGVR